MTKELSPRELADRLENYHKTVGALKNEYFTHAGEHGVGYCCLGVYAHECGLGKESDVRISFGGCITMIPERHMPGWMKAPISNHLTESTMLALGDDWPSYPMCIQDMESTDRVLAAINDRSQNWSDIYDLLMKIDKAIETGEKQ
jgi:hypothetical protein